MDTWKTHKIRLPQLDSKHSNDFQLWQNLSNFPLEHVTCRCRVKAPELSSDASPIYTLDLIFTSGTPEDGLVTELCDVAPHENGDIKHRDSSRKTPMTFILSQLELRESYPNFSKFAIKLVVPAGEGYAARSNILHQRMASCEHVESIHNFLGPLSEISSRVRFPADLEDFGRLIHRASGALVLQQNTNLSPIQVLDFIDSELTIRMSFPWLLPSKPPKQLIAALGSHRVQSMEILYNAAQNLGIRLILIASKDDNAYSHCHDGIIIIDMTLDDGLESRIVDAMNSFPETIGGVIGYRDTLLVTAAKVAERLGLPCLPPSAMSACVNKFDMRQRTMTNCSQLIYARDSEHLREQINVNSKPLEFPLVVKPSQGQGSVGVSKVVEMQQLFDAVAEIENHSRKSGVKSGIIVENYIDGPEIDANFVILDGEVLFLEVVDNFPCTADEQENRKTDSFLERDMVYPSGLSDCEILVVRDEILRLLVDNLGFRTGVFHVEARVCGSSMQYTEEEGITDLRATQLEKPTSPSIFILEVNARCPGVAGVHPTVRTHGVDLAALWLLAAVSDTERLRALSQTFINGPQVWCDLVPITVTRGGTLDSDDIMEELRQRRPDLMDHVSSTVNFYRRGDIIPEPSVTNLAGIIVEFVAFSRKSRGNLLYIVDQIRREVRIEWKEVEKPTHWISRFATRLRGLLWRDK